MASTTLSRGARRARSQRPRISSLRPCVSLRCGTEYLEDILHKSPSDNLSRGVSWKRGKDEGEGGQDEKWSVVVHLGGVEEVDAGVECGVEEAERLRQPALLPHRHRPFNTRPLSQKKTAGEREEEGGLEGRLTEAEAGDGEVGGEVEGGHRHRRRPPRRTVANPSPPPWRI